jgi:uncharacterized protein
MEEIIAQLPDVPIKHVRIGLHWTIVAAEVKGETRAGLASTVVGKHDHHNGHMVPDAGELENMTGQQLASLAQSDKALLRSIGFATINALIPHHPELWEDLNAEAVLTEQGKDKVVALIGSFPFISRLRNTVGELIVLEQNPGGDELPADRAPQVLPQADVVAITGMTLINQTLDGLLQHCRSDSQIMILGPTTPLSPLLFKKNIHMLSGAVVMNIDPVLRAVCQGANFRQVHRAGVKLVTMRAGNCDRD